MSKFCPKCGTQMNDNEVFCQKCGAKYEQANAPVANAPKQNNVVNDMIAKAKGSNKNLLVGVVAVAVVVIALIVLISSIFTSSYKDPIDNMIDVMFEGKVKKIEKLAPKEYWKYMEEEFDTELDEIIEQAEESIEYMMEMYEEEYGKNIKVKYKITDKDTLSDKKLDDIKEGLKDNYDIAKKSVKKAYKLEVEMTIKGKDDEDTDESDMIVAQIGNGWYIVSESGELQVGV